MGFLADEADQGEELVEANSGSFKLKLCPVLSNLIFDLVDGVDEVFDLFAETVFNMEKFYQLHTFLERFDQLTEVDELLNLVNSCQYLWGG